MQSRHYLENKRVTVRSLLSLIVKRIGNGADIIFAFIVGFIGLGLDWKHKRRKQQWAKLK